jgi:hypothetical protein
MLVGVERLDAHPADLDGRWSAVEVPGDLMLSELLTTVLEPFLEQAPRAAWVCRGASRGQWRDFAEVVTFGPPERLGARLLVADEPLHSFAGAHRTPFAVACRPREASAPDAASGSPRSTRRAP